MDATPPTWPPPNATDVATPAERTAGTAAAPVRRGGWSSVKVAVVLGTLAMAVAASAGFVSTRAAVDRRGPVPCGGTAGMQCIPALVPAAVVAELEERGFDCTTNEYDTSECDLENGGTSYDVTVDTSPEGRLVTRILVDVTNDPQASPSTHGTAFLDWFAALPFGNDRGADTVSRKWVAEHVGGDHEATIRGYLYRLSVPAPGHVGLEINPDSSIYERAHVNDR